VNPLCLQELNLSTGEKVTIPKGVEVLIPICLLNRDKDEWGEPITDYNPDRFKGVWS
jgi:cytochrome P450